MSSWLSLLTALRIELLSAIKRERDVFFQGKVALALKASDRESFWAFLRLAEWIYLRYLPL